MDDSQALGTAQHPSPPPQPQDDHFSELRHLLLEGVHPAAAGVVTRQRTRLDGTQGRCLPVPSVQRPTAEIQAALPPIPRQPSATSVGPSAGPPCAPALRSVPMVSLTGFTHLQATSTRPDAHHHHQQLQLQECWPAPHINPAAPHQPLNPPLQQQQQQQQGAVRIALAPVPQERRAKRNKPTARRSLQALFDAVAEGSSVAPSLSPSLPSAHTEDDADTACGSAGSTTTLASPAGALLGPCTPSTTDTAAADAGEPQHPARAGVAVPVPSSTLNLPLQQYLASERGRRLTPLEVKAIVVRAADDLGRLHARNFVHRRVSLASLSLACAPGGTAVAMLAPATSGVHTGSARVHWATREAGFDGYAPPEVAFCPADRTPCTPPGDVWALGVALFSLLSGGQLPFGPGGLCHPGARQRLPHNQTVDALQRWVKDHVVRQMEVANQLSAVQGQSRRAQPGMRVLGFDAQAAALLLDMLHADPAQRLPAAHVASHPWLAEVLPLLPPTPEELAERLAGAQAEAAAKASPPAAPAPAASDGSLGDIQRRTACLAVGTQSISIPSGRSHPSWARPPAGADSLDATTGSQDSASAFFSALSSYSSADLPLGAGATSSTSPTPAASAYPVIGHVAQPREVTVEGRRVVVPCYHAVYQVPGRGAMMTAQPVAIGQPEQQHAGQSAPGGQTQSRAAGSGHFMPLLARLVQKQAGC